MMDLLQLIRGARSSDPTRPEWTCATTSPSSHRAAITAYYGPPTKALTYSGEKFADIYTDESGHRWTSGPSDQTPVLSPLHHSASPAAVQLNGVGGSTSTNGGGATPNPPASKRASGFRGSTS
jgi:hypothetical protein